MTRKKKLIALSSLAIAVAMTIGLYLLWREHKEIENVAEWIEGIGGNITYQYPAWIYKFPSAMQTCVRNVISKDITGVYLSFTDVKDISPLKKLNQLENLYLSRTKVNDIKPLEKLTNILNLGLAGTPVSSEQLKELMTKIEGLIIY